MVPVLQVLLAHWYWDDFNGNASTQQTFEGKPNKNVRTWNLPRLLMEVESQLLKALAHEKDLKAIPIKTYDFLFDKGTVPDSYRPTLYDFIAHDALLFYTQMGFSDETETCLKLRAESPIFQDVAEFLKWQVEDQLDGYLAKAIKLQQHLLRVHQNDKDQSAFLDVNLQRLALGYEKALGQAKSGAAKAALQAFAEKYSKHELSALALSQFADVLMGEKNYIEARKIAQRGAASYPDSLGGKACSKIVADIEAPWSRVTAERVWNHPFADLRVDYCNLEAMHFRVVKADWEAVHSRSGDPEHPNDDVMATYVAAKPDAAWSSELPKTEYFRIRSQAVPVPKEIKPGFYCLLASKTKDFPKHPFATYFWVSELAMVSRLGRGDKLEGFVVNARTGQPVEGAQVTIESSPEYHPHLPLSWQKTDKNGLFSISRKAGGYAVQVEHGDQTVISLRSHVVRLEIRTDRDLEYVHLKDGRGSGTEPTNVLSGYDHQGQLGYYETTRDTASHFFIDRLPQGKHHLEYSLRAVHRGNYPMGLAEIQCMYAPEFDSHSESIKLNVR